MSQRSLGALLFYQVYIGMREEARATCNVAQNSFFNCTYTHAAAHLLVAKRERSGFRAAESILFYGSRDALYLAAMSRWCVFFIIALFLVFTDLNSDIFWRDVEERVREYTWHEAFFFSRLESLWTWILVWDILYFAAKRKTGFHSASAARSRT